MTRSEKKNIFYFKFLYYLIAYRLDSTFHLMSTSLNCIHQTYCRLSSPLISVTMRWIQVVSSIFFYILILMLVIFAITQRKLLQYRCSSLSCSSARAGKSNTDGRNRFLLAVRMTRGAGAGKPIGPRVLVRRVQWVLVTAARRMGLPPSLCRWVK